MKIVFPMPKKSRITQKDFQLDIGHSWIQTLKKCGMEFFSRSKRGQKSRFRRLVAVPRKHERRTSPSLGKKRWNGTWRIVIRKIWIVSMESRHSSSGKWTSSKRFKNLWKTYSASLRSCQCATTFGWEKKETQKDVNIIHAQLRIMFADFRAVIGHSWDLDQKWNGAKLILINQSESGTKRLNKWWSTLQKSLIRYSVPPVPLKEKN